MEFRILGPLEVVGDLGAISLGGPQQRRVLAALLSDPGYVLTYERLVEVLWPDDDAPGNARRSAITYVSRLRAALGDGVIETTDAGYVLDASTSSIDAERFIALVDHAATVPAERALDVLDEAMSLWRGPVFGDLNGEWWARPLVKKLEELRLTALASRVDAMTVGGWSGHSIAEITSLVDAHPLREQFVEKAMRGLHSIGQAADALRAFHRYRTELADQTGLDPSSALRDLESSMTTGAALEPTSADVARPLRGYVLREVIGEGSFGAVYRATQPGVDRDVAVKVIRPELADDRSFVLRFEAEAQLVARLEHPHIVPLYDFWRQPGGAFLVFRLMRGGSADALIARHGPLSLERAGAVLEHIGGALSAAHAERVVHRDVKPANILFDDAGLAYLADFGIAVSFGDEPAAPQRWSAGSALYASPEQLRDGVEDARADQYALAATVWELLAGRAPFGGSDASTVVETKLREPLGALDAVRPDVPPSLAAVLTRAGAVHPLDRYPTVADFVVAWQRAFTGVAAGDTAPASPLADAAMRSAASTMATAGHAVANPYKGLRPFGEGDVNDFRGRATLVERLVEEVGAHSFVSVVGPSGSGKSSLVLAGLVPRLRQQRCLVAIMTPGESPFVSLSAALSQLAKHNQAELLSPAAMRRADGLREVIEAIVVDDELVIVIDQLEELWTLAGEDERQRFLAGLVDPVRAGFVRIVVTIRADFFDRPLADVVLGPLVSACTLGVTPMTMTELHDAITAPAEDLGVRFEPALVSRLVAETVDQPGSLPLLQFALAELFEGRHGAVITAESYDELGGLAGSLSRQADEIYNSSDEADRAGVRRLFSRLVAPGEGNEDTRRRVVVSDLAGVPQRVVAAYVDRRLLTGDRDRLTREPTVEVAHEVLLRSWPRLRSWLVEDRSWLRELRGLSAAAAQWDNGGCVVDDLYGGARLAVVSELVTAHPEALTELEQRFLDQSLDQSAAKEREARRRLDDKVRQNKRLRRSLVGIVVVLAMAIGAGVVAFGQRRNAEQQRSDALAAKGKAQKSAADARTAQTASELTTLAATSLSTRSSQRDLAALLAVESWKRSPNATSKSALFGTFTFDPGFVGYVRFDGSAGVQGLAIPGTTNMLVSIFPRDGSVTGPPQVVDAVSGQTVLRLDRATDPAAGYIQLQVSPNGRFGAEWAATTLGAASVLAVYDLATGTVVGQPLHMAALREPFAIDPTGSRVAVEADGQGSVFVYDVNDGHVVASIPAAADAPAGNGVAAASAITFGPDGRLYVGSKGQHLRVFDATTFTLVDDIAVPALFTTGLMRLSDDGTSLVVRSVHDDPANGAQRGSIIRVDLTSRRIAWQVSGVEYGFGECSSFAFSVTTDQLWCGNYFGRVRERSFSTGARTGRVLQNQKGWATHLDLIPVPGGVMLAGTGNNDGVISRWIVDGGGPIQQLVAKGHVIVGAFADGKTLLVATPNGAAPPFDLSYTLWDVGTDAEVPGLPGFIFATVAGNAVAGAFSDVTFGSYDLSTKKRTVLPISLAPPPTSQSASLDGTVWLLGYADGHVDERSTQTGELLQRVQLPRAADSTVIAVDTAAISKDHRRIYVTGDGLVAFDAATGELLNRQPDLAIANVVVSPAGELVAASVDGTLGIYDGESLAKTASLPGARGYIQNMFFSADDATLVAAGNDGSVSIYDFASRTRLGDAIDMNLNQGVRTALRADGAVVAIETPRADGIELWDLDPARWVAAACALAGRNLTREEWDTYLGGLGPYEATCPDYSPAPKD